MPSPLMTVADLAKFLNVSERHVRGLVYRRAIPFLKIGRQTRFDPRKIDRWLESNSEQVAS